MPRVNAAWIQPVSTDPVLLVDREEEQSALRGYIVEHLDANLHDVQILVSGARGVGKSILTRAVLKGLERDRPHDVIALVIDGRGQRHREFLRQFANGLADAVRARCESPRRADLLHWADQLGLLANSDTLSRSQTETLAKKYGADATAATDVLLYKLQGRFTWDETRSLGNTVQSTFVVTDSLLHASIVATLERLAKPDFRWKVVVFYDDLDQAIFGEQEADVAPVLRQILDLRPCISLVHFRTEALIENVTREIGEQLDVKPLQPKHLLEVLQARLQWASEVVQRQFPPETDWGPMERLAKATGNPLVFLKWAHALLRTQPWPPPPTWTELPALTELVFASSPMNGADPALVHRLMEVVDRCDGGHGGRVLHREDLLRGCARMDPSPPKQGLTEQEIDDLLRLNVLLPRHRFQPAMGCRAIPVLDLLRAGVRQRL